MNWKKEAIEIRRKFASGVNCPKWDENTIKQTMLHIGCEKIAKEKGKKEIDQEVVKAYILERHNIIIVISGKINGSNLDKILNCMVVPKKTDKGWACSHGKAQGIFPITEQEAKDLEASIKKLTRELQ